MGQAESPEPQVGGRVGDAAQAKLDGVDGLMQELVCKVKLREQQDEMALRMTAGEKDKGQEVAAPTSSAWCSPLEERSPRPPPSSRSWVLIR